MNEKQSFTKNDTLIVKVVAIMMMLFHHCFTTADRYAGYEISFAPLGEGLTVEIASFFKICVAIFVFLSGYGITVSLSKIAQSDFAGYKNQLKKRYISLMSSFWPIYIIGLIVSAIIMPSMLRIYKGTNRFDCVLFAFFDFMGLSELFGTPTLIGTWWYMSLALIVVAIMPILYRAYKKYGCLPILILTFLLCGLVHKSFNDKVVNFDMIRWLFTLELGMFCADTDFLAKIKLISIVKEHHIVDYIIKFCMMTVVLGFCFYLRQRSDCTVSYIRDGIIPAYVVLYCYVIISEIPIINRVLKFLGKHSNNIFLSHTFLRGYFLKDFIYSMKYPLLIFIVLLILSVALSILIDLVKKCSGYDKLTKWVTARVMT